MLVGQNPGFTEDRYGYRPFVGQAGQYLDSLLFQAGIPRETVAITNLVHCKSPNNRTLKIDEIHACSHWLETEIDIVQPHIIVAMGKSAIDYFIPNNTDTLDHLHAKPFEKDGRIILPTYHPAAALHDTTHLRQCSEDFQVLRGLAKGRDWHEYLVKDEYPRPEYHVIDTQDKLRALWYLVEDAGEFAVDTEQVNGKLWSVQISCKEGEAYFIPIKGADTFDLTFLKATAIVHYYLHDIEYSPVRDDQFLDTMTMAYLTGAGSQGLKELASRLCGMKMTTYSEMVRPAQQKLSLEYLHKASKRDWGDPPPVEETGWNNKAGCIVTRMKKPQHISRKISRILSDFEKDPNLDVNKRWHDIPEEERAEVEGKMGVMPESSLADIKFEDAVFYSARDSDATLRVYHKLKQQIQDLDLDFILRTDLDILPMVRSMMANGMAVDVDHYRKLSEEYDVRMRVKADELAGMVGHSFNPNSSPQVATVIYGELGFKPTKMNPETKLISTDDAELKKTGHPVAKGIIQYRQVLKLKSTYADNMIRSAHPDENGIPRIHTKLNTTRVETGRLSSSKDDNGEGANLQNIPTRNEDSKAIKNGFVAPPGKVLAEVDLGQIEVRTQTHLAKCKGLIELFNSGKDPHTTTAAKLFGIPYEEAKQNKFRYPTKRASFGIIYLIGAQGLSTQINEYIADLEMAGEKVDIDPWDVDTCQKFIDDYYKLYPEIRDYQLEQAAMARRLGYTRDIAGRIRYIPEVSCPIRAISEAGCRQAANFPVTSSAQYIIKAAMGRMWRELPQTEWIDNVTFLMQVHDSMVLELTDNEKIYKPSLKWVKDIMCHTVELVIPIDADVKVGKRWGDLEKLKLED